MAEHPKAILAPDLKKFEQDVREKYMVGVVFEAVECFTVLAANPDAAMKAVHDGFGRPAGREGPRTIVVLTKKVGLADPDGKSVKFLNAYDEMRKQVASQQKQAEPAVVVPKIVVPKGL